MAAERPVVATNHANSSPGPRRPRRILTVAAAGYGKTTSLEADLPRDGVLISAADLLAAGLPTVAGSATVCVDDLDRLEPADQREVVHQIRSWPDRIGVRIASGTPLPTAVRDTLGGLLFERGPADLALDPHQTGRVLTDEYGVTDPQAHASAYLLTRGWPALVHFAGDLLARGTHPELELELELTRPGSALRTWITSEVLAVLPPPVAEALTLLSGLDPVQPDLVRFVCAQRGVGGGESAFEWLRAAGLLVPHRRVALAGDGGWSTVPLLASAVAAAGRDADPRATAVAAGQWYEGHGYPLCAARAHALAGDSDRAERMVAARGPDMLAHGDAAGVLALVDLGLIDAKGASTRQVVAEAALLSGDSARARRLYAPLVREADASGWTTALAHRVAALHYTFGDLHEAVAALDRAPACGGEPEEERVHWLACRATVRSMLGRDAGARRDADAALALAETLGSPRALGAGHQAVAKCRSGSRKQAHLAQAADAARRAGDIVALARILGNQSYVLLVGARYREALPVCRAALHACELARPMGALPVALHNLAEALARVGDYDEARWHLERAVAVCRRLAPTRTSSALLGLGDVHRVLGHQEQARAAYEEAIVLARSSDEGQVLVPALAGLARVLAPASPGTARAAAEEAYRFATGGLAPYALTALGWVDLASGEREDAAHWAARSVAAARDCQALDLLAEALELAAVAPRLESPAAHAALTEARAIWREGGAEPDACRVEVLLGRRQDADSATRSQARQAARYLQRLGITQVCARPTGDDSASGVVVVRVLGGFAVEVDHQPVPLPAWRSRQARTLVKILVSRRGVPASRGYLCELLWPDDDPAKTGHRLSVLLATVRGVLDPGRNWPADRYIGADQDGIWLDLQRVSVDAERLLVDSAGAGELLARGELERAVEILTDIEARYRGDAFADETYEEWADGPREQVRAAWLRALRHLATVQLRRGQVHDGAAVLVRLLGTDPYDERAHRALVTALVRAGRHGEARRAFARWTEAMLDVDAPAPDPAVLRRPGASTAAPASPAEGVLIPH